jgi:hypothetical protein
MEISGRNPGFGTDSTPGGQARPLEEFIYTGKAGKNDGTLEGFGPPILPAFS